MNRNAFMRKSVMTGVAFLLASSQAMAVFVSKGRSQQITARATTSGTGSLTITALPLSTQVFSGKHFVIPVQIVASAGTLVPTSLQIAVVYQLYDVSGNPIGGSSPAIAPVQYIQSDPSNPSRVTGTAYIDRTDLDPIQEGGQVKYFFRVLQGAAGVYLGGGTAGTAAYPTSASLSALIINGYTATVVTTYDAPVNPAGSAAYVPDTFETDGLTGLQLGVGAVTNAGTLHVENLDLDRIPSGPGGSKAVVAYNFVLIGTSLQRSAQLVLSYPADLNGQIADNGGNPLNLAPYWWDGASWRVLGRPQIDTTLHTVTVALPPPASGSIGKTVIPPTLNGISQVGAGEQYEASFALFAAGAATAASLRPIERIITPNGDGINDEAGFSGLTATDEVHIFDVRGRRVRTLGVGAICRYLTDASRCWDGRDDGGSIVDSGVYIYQFMSQGSRVSGVIAVAK